MEPKTKLQKLVAGLSAKLPAITHAMAQWAYPKCFDSYAYRSRKTLFCLDCGHSWADDCVLITAIDGGVCPECSAKFKMAKWTAHKRQEYFAVVTVAGGFQVVRLVCVYKDMKKGRAAQLYYHEVMQHFIDAAGNMTTLSKSVQSYTRCYDMWVYNSCLEFRVMSSASELRNNLNPWLVYPRKRVLPVLKRNGFKGNFHDVPPQILFKLLLSDPFAETLQKAGYTHLLTEYYNKPAKVTKFWPAIKIAIRNRYKIKDAGIWLDYLQMLEGFNKDLRNAKFVCPPNFKTAHDAIMQKRRAIQDRAAAVDRARLDAQKEKKREEVLKKIDAAQIEYQNSKAKFFGIQFSKGNLSVKVLESVEEFLQEGDLHKHCVFTSEYFKEPDSLILSARVDDTPVETVEVSLSQLKILQARGYGNKATGHHDEIISLVNKNLHRIRAAV